MALQPGKTCNTLPSKNLFKNRMIEDQKNQLQKEKKRQLINSRNQRIGYKKQDRNMFDTKIEIDKIKRKLCIIAPEKTEKIEKLCLDLFFTIKPNLKPENCLESLEEEWIEKWLTESRGTE